MSYKSRVNWRVGICFPTCKCISCRRKNEEEKEKIKSEETKGSMGDKSENQSEASKEDLQ